MSGSKSGGDLVLIDTSMPFIYTRTGVTFESSKAQIKTRSPLASFAPRPGFSIHNSKKDYSQMTFRN